MKDKVLLGLAGLLVLMSIAVDFTSKIMSIGSDLVLIGLAGFLAYLSYKDRKQNK